MAGVAGAAGGRRRHRPGRERQAPAVGAADDAGVRDAVEPAGGHPEDAPGDPEQIARTICLRMLTGAPRTRSQLADALVRRGLPDDVVARVLDRFADVGLIDDATFARMWVSSRHAGRGLAGRALGHELRRRGVDGQTADEAVAELDSETERETAHRLVRGRLATLNRHPTEVVTRRLVSMLARKGYSPGVAYTVVRAELAAAGRELAQANLADDIPHVD